MTGEREMGVLQFRISYIDSDWSHPHSLFFQIINSSQHLRPGGRVRRLRLRPAGVEVRAEEGAAAAVGAGRGRVGAGGRGPEPAHDAGREAALRVRRRRIRPVHTGKNYMGCGTPGKILICPTGGVLNFIYR